MKKFELNKLYSLMVMIPTVLVPTSTTLYASDLAIYKGSTTGKTSILMMLDTSGSMGISSLVLPKNNLYGSPGDVDAPLCGRTKIDEANNSRNTWYKTYEWTYNLKDPATDRTAIGKSVTIGGTTIPYYVRGCTKNGVTQYDRLSRLKDAILPLLASNELSDDVMMGLGQFSSKTELTIGTATNRLTDGHSGRILVPNAALTNAQRIKIAREIAAIKSLDTLTNEDGTPNTSLKLSSDTYPNVTKASSGTPTAHAYAEAAAYMMGTGTGTGGVNSGRIDIIYDGYMVKQQGENDGQVYLICVELGASETTALGATVKQCPSNWPHDKYDSTNRTTTDAAIIYKPNGTNPDGTMNWARVNPTQLKNQVGSMNSAWDIYTKLPFGWRLDGWMKVDNEPMDIEPIVGTVWTYNDNIRGLVSYRTNPFSIRSGQTTTTTTTQGFQNCPSGFNILSAWDSLCYQTGSFSRSATTTERNNKTCSSPAKGDAPLPNARNPNGSFNSNENYNKSSSGYPGGGGLSYNNTYKTCNQTSYVVNRPWGPVTQTITTTGPIDNNIGGFAYSASDTKSGSNYIAGGSTGTCDGNGIYMLTDGAPNSTKDTMARTIMNKSLQDSTTYSFTAKPSGAGVLVSPALNSGLFTGETGGWEYIGEYAKKLRNRTEASNTQKNPKDMNIKTAVVGFGSSFAGLTRNADGSYDCASAPNDDAKNACLWGSSSYGDGGFYYAENSEDIKKSIVDFVEKTAASIPSTSLGTISIPLDPLDQTKAMPTGFFPMVQPLTDSSKRTWLGNLKKYYVLNGTLKDSATGGNALYQVADNEQIINPNAKDIWSLQVGGDHSSINSGGAWNKIPVPADFSSTVNAINNTTSVRRVYTMDGSSLKRVAKENLATDYVPAGEGALAALSAANISVSQRYALLNYLGYAKPLPATVPAALTASEISALAIPASPYRYLGGVVHSTPLVVTKEATIGSNNTVSNREEYVVYGSMDGGLHIVSASSGEEKSVFVPQEILANQPETLINENAVNSTLGLAYGVDAPWVADNTFKVTSTTSGTTTTTKYSARTMNIYGGLRMGGSALYGLNISTPTAPSLLFRIAPSTTGFSRLSQIWSKPAIANIRVKGAIKKVLIFGGGYDKDIYENDSDKTVAPAGPTLGNALYIVDASDGTLLWSVSSSNSGTAVTSNSQKQDDVKFSVVGQPAVRDYNADGLADAIWFADLGGQVFRVDLNNATQIATTAANNLAVRTQTIAKLATSTFTPRFYERPSTAVFKEGQERFVLVTMGSGNRSYPLTKDAGLNKVYGTLDWDAAASDLEKSTFTPSATITDTDLVTTGVLGKTQTAMNTATDIAALKAKTKKGWAFSLKNGTAADNGLVKAMEETQLVGGDLYVSVYDPNALLGDRTASACGGGIQGLSTIHRVCMPYGNCAAYATTDNQGIIGVPFGAVSSDEPRKTRLISPTPIDGEKCVGDCEPKNANGVSKPIGYDKSRLIRPIRWYEW